jgi:hypothetical protein
MNATRLVCTLESQLQIALLACLVALRIKSRACVLPSVVTTILAQNPRTRTSSIGQISATSRAFLLVFTSRTLRYTVANIRLSNAHVG